jgi:hypothetical protein
MIDIITFTLGGRDRYLFKCLDSVYDDINNQLIPNEIRVRHHLIMQGADICKDVQSTLETYGKNECYELIIHEWPDNIGIGAGLNKIIPECGGELIFKMDDDCKIISQDFFYNAYCLYNKFPNSVFSPFPTGLLRSLGGSQGLSHQVWNDKTNNIMWTKRIVNHVGGFARFAPTSIMKSFQFPNDKISGISGTEDGNFSSYCNSNGIELFYLENDLIVSHQETCYGQILRYPEYFKDRSWESSVKLNVIY